MPSISVEKTSFWEPAKIPENVRGIRVGDWVQVPGDAPRVSRFGYRLQGEEALMSLQVRQPKQEDIDLATRQLLRAAEVAPVELGRGARRRLTLFLEAVALQKVRWGGPFRGAHVLPPLGEEILTQVQRISRHQVGKRSYNGEYYELEGQRTILVLHTLRGSFFSGSVQK